MTTLVTDIANLADIDALIELEKMCFETDRLSAKQFRHFIRSSTALVAAVKQHSKLIAAAVLLFRKNSSIARLYSIAVNPTFQQHGIAQGLNQFLERFALKQSYSEIRLEVRKNNDRAIRFYRKNGYEAFGEYKNFYEDGADAMRMRKKLSPTSNEIETN
jgi:ribosomal protein S18 acetylase RimI-like enzyme